MATKLEIECEGLKTFFFIIISICIVVTVSALAIISVYVRSLVSLGSLFLLAVAIITAMLYLQRVRKLWKLAK